MKFSTTFTLATLALLSMGTQARIGQGQHRQLGSHGEKCNPNYGGQCFHLGKDFKCQNTVGFGATPDYRCVNTKPLPPPITPPPAPAPAKPKTCNPNQNPTYTPECPSGFTCKAILGSSKKNAGQCMKQSDPKPAPTPAPKKCNPNQNPTYTPECPRGYTCEALLGSSKKNVGQCMKQSNRRVLGQAIDNTNPDELGSPTGNPFEDECNINAGIYCRNTGQDTGSDAALACFNTWKYQIDSCPVPNEDECNTNADNYCRISGQDTGSDAALACFNTWKYQNDSCPGYP